MSKRRRNIQTCLFLNTSIQEFYDLIKKVTKELIDVTVGSPFQHPLNVNTS